MINERQEWELTGKGDCREHYHLEDRGPFPIPHGSFYDTTSQTAVSTTAAYPMMLNSTVTHAGVDLEAGSRVVIRQPGIYNIQFSAQFANPDAQDYNVAIWLRVSGADVPESCTALSVPSKHGSSLGHHVAAWNFMQRMQRGEYFEMVWATESTSVYIAALTSSAGPPSRPAIPSVIVTANMVSI